jgi:hypothetical protein
LQKVHHAREARVGAEDDVIDATDLSEELADRVSCKLTHELLVDAVATDCPTGPHYFSRKALENYLLTAQNGTSQAHQGAALQDDFEAVCPILYCKHRICMQRCVSDKQQSDKKVREFKRMQSQKATAQRAGGGSEDTASAGGGAATSAADGERARLKAEVSTDFTRDNRDRFSQAADCVTTQAASRSQVVATSSIPRFS